MATSWGTTTQPARRGLARPHPNPHPPTDLGNPHAKGDRGAQHLRRGGVLAQTRRRRGRRRCCDARAVLGRPTGRAPSNPAPRPLHCPSLPTPHAPASNPSPEPRPSPAPTPARAAAHLQLPAAPSLVGRLPGQRVLRGWRLRFVLKSMISLLSRYPNPNPPTPQPPAAPYRRGSGPP